MSARQRLELKSARCFALKNYRGALRHLRELLEQVGENPQTLYMIAQCHERLGELAEALSHAERALAADPEHLEALQLVAKVHVMREAHDEACESVRRGLALVARRRAANPPATDAARATGALRRWLGRASWLRAEPEDPDYALWLSWAEAYLRRHGGEPSDDG